MPCDIIKRMDVERTMQFILDAQARLEASAQRHDEMLNKNAEQIAALTASVQKHDEQLATITDLVGRLAQAEIRLVEQVRENEARWAEQHRDLDKKMAQFLDRMDRYIKGSEGNGRKRH